MMGHWKERMKSGMDFCMLTIQFARNDLKKRYAGSNLGALWAYIQTFTMVLIYWVVFEYGLKNGSVQDIPFLPWFIAGMMPWLLFSDIINSAMYCMSEYSYIVKKVVFNVDIIPACKVAVSVFIYSFFLLIVIAVALCSGLFTGWYILQVLLYFAADLLLAVSLAYASSTVSVFFKDFGQIVGIVLNAMMWATPIVWEISVVPEAFRWIFKLNPVYFVVNGFRDSLLYGVPFWSDPSGLFYFLAVTCALWAVCIPVYRRLLPHMADIL